MYISKIKNMDIANGPGVRVSVFVSGCNRHCKGCFNSETHDFNNGAELTIDIIDDIIKFCNNDYITGLSILGGEPFEPNNVDSVIDIVKLFKTYYPTKSVWIWSGYTINELLSNKKQSELLWECDYIVDGEWKQELKDLSISFRGSSNQKIYRLDKRKKKFIDVCKEFDKF